MRGTKCLILTAVIATLVSSCAKQTNHNIIVDLPSIKAPQGAILNRDLIGSMFERTVGDKVFFDFDKSTLTPDSKIQLMKWVSFLEKYPNDHLMIEGHCDERGTREYNLALGERRANTVKKFLISQGVAESRLTIVSYGKERPLILSSNDPAWAQNRRAVGVIE